MNIKLHNKYEITLGDKCWTAYNTITQGIFDAIANFENYGTGIAVGSGTTKYDSKYNRLANYVKVLPAEIEEIQSDPSKGQMYIKRTASLSGDTSFNLSELGLCSGTYAYDFKDVRNHAYIQDDYGDITPIFKDPETDLFIRLTMYLEIDEQTKSFLTAGDNLLVKAIFGTLGYTPNISIARGYNNTPNQTFVHRNTPKNSKRYNVSVVRESGNTTQSIGYKFDIKSGETAEIVLLFDDTPVARLSTIGDGHKTSETLENLVSQTNYTLDLGASVAEVDQVTDQEGQQVTDYKLRTYAREFSDDIKDAFEASFDSNCARWLSYDGDKLAFVADGKVYVYLNKNYALYKILNDIPSTNLTKIIMFESYIFAIYSQGEHIRAYTIDENLTANSLNVDLSVYENYETTYDWQEIEIISAGQNNFVIGIILGAIARKPIILKATLSENNFSIDQVSECKSGYAVFSFSLYKNNFCDSMIGFITDQYKGTAENYRIEHISADGQSYVTDEMQAYYLCTNAVSVEGKSRALIGKMTQSPYIWLYYYPQAYRYSISLTSGVKNWLSTDLMYLIQKYDDGQYKIYSLNDYNNPQEFVDGLPAEIDQSTIVDFEFLHDTLIVFTTEKTYVLNLKINQTVLENMPEANANYNVSLTKELLIGSNQNEGIKGSFKLEFQS